MSSRSPHPYEDDKDRHKKIKLASVSVDSELGDFSEPAILKSGVFWDIENIPVKKAQAARRVPDIKKAMTNFVRNVNHYNVDNPPNKQIEKFIVVARQKGQDTMPTTAEVVKKHVVDNQIELLDLPYSSDPDFCDDAIYRSVVCFTEENLPRSLVVAMTGDVGLVRRINRIQRDFDLLVVMQRAGKRTEVMQRHCDKIKQTNEHGRQQAVYFFDEVIRKCLHNDSIPLTFSHLLRLKARHDRDPTALDENNHLAILFGENNGGGTGSTLTASSSTATSSMASSGPTSDSRRRRKKKAQREEDQDSAYSSGSESTASSILSRASGSDEDDGEASSSSSRFYRTPSSDDFDRN
ncbi:hypothetical protein RvY_16162 [Ramazzottius varieornatus]|uniref:NYN domain-containing protein n=1 Tax=Ramazzottius varieornatus TaxID=947166 RepID=A0A1D1VYG1_RAMVA|nr:hypothetical protein RvY_16162 [Ramazzottius varieornatus]